MTQLFVSLPWPSPKLSPNARVHWAELGKVKKAYRADCHALCKASGFRAGVYSQTTELRLTLEFVPPTKAKRDLDNCLASMKAGLDGIADSLGVDDSRFTIELRMVKDRVAGIVNVRVDDFSTAAA